MKKLLVFLSVMALLSSFAGLSLMVLSAYTSSSIPGFLGQVRLLF